MSDAPEAHFGWAEKIVDTLYCSGKYHEAISFATIAIPSSETDKIVELILQCHIATDLISAIYFSRLHSGNSRKSHLFKIFDSVFNCSDGANQHLMKQLYKFAFQKEEESELMEYCENSNSLQCRKFLLEFYIRHCRFSEALECNARLFSNDASNPEDQQRMQIMKNILLCLPPSLRNSFRLSATRSAGANEQLKPVALSQSTAIRGKSFSQQELLQALKDNYVQDQSKITKKATTPLVEDTTMDLDNTFEQENQAAEPLRLRTPVKPIDEQPPVSVSQNKRISSPFVKQPYTPPVGVTAAQYLCLTRSEKKSHAQFKEPYESPLLQSKPLGSHTASPGTTTASPRVNAPPLINRSPFVKHTTDFNFASRLPRPNSKPQSPAQFQYSVNAGSQTVPVQTTSPNVNESISRIRANSPLAKGSQVVSSKPQSRAPKSRAQPSLPKSAKPKSNRKGASSIVQKELSETKSKTHSRNGSAEEKPVRSTPARRAKIGVTYTEPSLSIKPLQPVKRIPRSHTTSEVPDTPTEEMISTSTRRSLKSRK